MLSAIQNFFFSNERFRFGRHRRRRASFNRERRLSFPELSPPSSHPSFIVTSVVAGSDDSVSVGTNHPVAVSYRPCLVDSTGTVAIDHQSTEQPSQLTAPSTALPLQPPTVQLPDASNRQRKRLKLLTNIGGGGGGNNNPSNTTQQKSAANVQSKKSLLTKFLFCCRSCCCCCCNCDDDGSFETDTIENGTNCGVGGASNYHHHHSHHQLSTIVTTESVPVPLTPAPSSLDAQPQHRHRHQDQSQNRGNASNGQLEQLSAASLGTNADSIANSLAFSRCSATGNTFAHSKPAMHSKPTAPVTTGQLDDLSMMVYHRSQPTNLSFLSSSSNSNRIVPTAVATNINNQSNLDIPNSSYNCDINQIDTVPHCQIVSSVSNSDRSTSAICTNSNDIPSNSLANHHSKSHQIVPSSSSSLSSSSSSSSNWSSSPSSKRSTGFQGFFSNSTGPLKQIMMMKNGKTQQSDTNNNNAAATATIQRQMQLQQQTSAAQTNRMQVSSKRLMKEIGDLMRKQNFQQQQSNTSTSLLSSSSSSSSSTTTTAISKNALRKQLFSVELVNDSLYEWYIKIYEFDKDSQIALDMQEYNIPYVLLHVVFPDSYPFDPPFVRVVVPYIERGYVMEGGAICLELLTKNGWTSAYTVEAVIFQLMASFVKGQARIKANKDPSKCFTRKSAENSFRHIVRIHDKHGWVDTPLFEG